MWSGEYGERMLDLLSELSLQNELNVKIIVAIGHEVQSDNLKIPKTPNIFVQSKIM